MALSRDVVIRLQGDADSAIKAQKAAADAAGVTAAAYRRAEREFAKQQAALETAARHTQATMQTVGKTAVGMGAVIALGLAASTKAAVNWESAWAGVQKTVSGTPAQMAALEKELRNLATTLPATHQEIAGVAEAAGQLGIARGDIVEFTKVAIAMGVSTNLSAEDAATGLARMSNIMGTASSDVDRMGSTLVALGNAGASTEQEILDMGLRIGAAGRQAGLTEGEVLGLANSMSSLGIEAEAGGTAISTVIKDINSSVLDGGDKLEQYAEVAGTTAQEFATAWKTDAASALVTIVEGLARMQAEGKNVNTVISDLGLDGIRTSDTLLRLAGNAEGLAASLKTGNQAWADNNALMNEANKRYETTASKLAIARNQISDAAIDIGNLLLPVLATGADLVADFARGFESLPGPLKDVVSILGLLAATVGTLGGAAIIAVPKIAAFRAQMRLVAAEGGTFAAGLSRGALFMTGPWGAAIGVATIALGTLITWLGASSQASESAAGYQRDLASALRESGGAIDDNVRALAAQKAADEAIGDSNLLGVAERLGFSLPKVTDALLGNRDAYNELVGAANAYYDESLKAEHAGDPEFTKNAEDARLFVEALGELSNSMGGAVADNQRLAEAQQASGEAASGLTGILAQLPEAADSASAGIAGVGDTAGLTQDQIDAAVKAIEEWRTELQSVGESFVEPLGVYKGLLDEKTQAEQEAAQATADSTDDASDSWKDYVGDVTVSIGELAAELDKQIAAQDNWRSNLVAISQRGGLEVAQILADMGVAGASTVQAMVDANEADFAHMRDSLIRDARLGGEGAAAELDTQMRVMAAVGASGGKATADEIARQLGIGVDEVLRIAGGFGINLAAGINPILSGLGKPQISTKIRPLWSGGYTGDGGKYEPMALVHGGEFVLTKEQTARAGVANLYAMASALDGYAGGGFVSPESVPRPPSTAPFRYPISTPADATMQREYDEAVAWVRNNLASTLGVFAPGAPAASGTNQAIVQQLAASMYGWVGAQWNSLYALIMKESGFRNTAQNPTSTAYGMFQFLDGTWAGYGVPKTSDPRLQTIAGLRYIASRYGSPSGALAFHLAHNWYGAGGVIPEPVFGVGRSGQTYMFGERGPETVTPGIPVAAGGGGGGYGPLNVVVNARVFVGNREITDIARVEAKAVVVQDRYRQGVNARSS